ncbi:MAG: hypothetical protein ACQESC_01580 [Nanobdellota archaeon]
MNRLKPKQPRSYPKEVSSLLTQAGVVSDEMSTIIEDYLVSLASYQQQGGIDV